MTDTQLIGIAILLIWVYLIVLTKWAASVQAWGKDIEKQHAAQQSVQPTCGIQPAPQQGIQNEYDPALENSRVPPASG